MRFFSFFDIAEVLPARAGSSGSDLGPSLCFSVFVSFSLGVLVFLVSKLYVFMLFFLIFSIFFEMFLSVALFFTLLAPMRPKNECQRGAGELGGVRKCAKMVEPTPRRAYKSKIFNLIRLVLVI